MDADGFASGFFKQPSCGSIGTVLTVLTGLTVLKADRIDEVDRLTEKTNLVNQSTRSAVNPVNPVNSVNPVNTVQNPSTPPQADGAFKNPGGLSPGVFKQPYARWYVPRSMGCRWLHLIGSLGYSCGV